MGFTFDIGIAWMLLLFITHGVQADSGNKNGGKRSVLYHMDQLTYAYVIYCGRYYVVAYLEPPNQCSQCKWYQ